MFSKSQVKLLKLFDLRAKSSCVGGWGVERLRHPASARASCNPIYHRKYLIPALKQRSHGSVMTYTGRERRPELPSAIASAGAAFHMSCNIYICMLIPLSTRASAYLYSEIFEETDFTW